MIVSTRVTTALEEIILFERIRNDDRAALERLFQQYYQRLCRVAYFLLDDKLLSEEVVADVFVNLWQKRKHLNISTNLEGYLHVATRNMAKAQLRKKQVYYDELTVLDNDMNHALIDNPENQMIQKELQAQYQKACEALPPKCRMVFEMSRVDGLTCREISEALDLSLKTVENHILNALTQIRKQVKSVQLAESRSSF